MLSHLTAADPHQGYRKTVGQFYFQRVMLIYLFLGYI
jgi:hypothetical protein